MVASHRLWKVVDLLLKGIAGSRWWHGARGRLGTDKKRGARDPQAYPPFISRSLVMNCCGLSQMLGVLYPMERAMSATKALQL